VKKQGVLAGTYFNDDTEVSRLVQGIADTESRRAVMT